MLTKTYLLYIVSQSTAGNAKFTVSFHSHFSPLKSQIKSTKKHSLKKGEVYNKASRPLRTTRAKKLALQPLTQGLVQWLGKYCDLEWFTVEGSDSDAPHWASSPQHRHGASVGRLT